MRAGLRQFFARAVPAGQPERQPQFPEDRQIGVVAGTVDGLAVRSQLKLAAGRRVVSAGHGGFDDEAGQGILDSADQHGGEGGGRNDGQESGAVQRGQGLAGFQERGGIQGHADGFGVAGAGDVQRIRRGPVFGQRFDGGGKFHGDARAHDDHRGARQHGAVERGQMRHLDFFEEIDADGTGMAFAGQEHFDEIGGDAQRLRRQVGAGDVHAGSFVRRAGGTSVGQEMGVEDFPGDFGKGEMLQGPADVPLPVAVLQAARQDLVEARAGDDA